MHGGLTSATVGQGDFTTLIYNLAGGGALVDPEESPTAQTKEEKAGFPEASLNALW